MASYLDSDKIYVPFNDTTDVDNAISDLPEIADGLSTKINTDVAGFVSIDSTATKAPLAAAISNSTSESSLMGASDVDFAANHFSLNSMMRLTFAGNLLNNTGGSVTYTFKLKVDTSVAFTVVVVVATPNAAARLWYANITAQFLDFFGTKVLNTVGSVSVSSPDGTGGVDLGTYTSYGAVSSFNFAAAHSMDWTVQMSTASASATTTMTLAQIGETVAQ